ncbi:hypothetical protein MJG53_016467 [Ovis ammon polii x Ovis aries]|uniref:Uncharacterized protein n=1 Tax=Ovis ammon polii x Ovis aries TaxID=2918886 RepID=A0ACB9UC27_9CETA|nr:hypothetical protein MJG53_016467 [Ovis ammon polii x Ovis aries]
MHPLLTLTVTQEYWVSSFPGRRLSTQNQAPPPKPCPQAVPGTSAVDSPALEPPPSAFLELRPPTPELHLGVCGHVSQANGCDSESVRGSLMGPHMALATGNTVLGVRRMSEADGPVSQEPAALICLGLRAHTAVSHTHCSHRKERQQQAFQIPVLDVSTQIHARPQSQGSINRTVSPAHDLPCGACCESPASAVTFLRPSTFPRHAELPKTAVSVSLRKAKQRARSGHTRHSFLSGPMETPLTKSEAKETSVDICDHNSFQRALYQSGRILGQSAPGAWINLHRNGKRNASFILGKSGEEEEEKRAEAELTHILCRCLGPMKMF